MCKVSTKDLVRLLQKVFAKFDKSSQYGFNVGRNVLHNVLNDRLYLRTHQELIIV